MTRSDRYWFAAKRYGWGWGQPIAWQGWMVMLVFMILVLAGAVVILPSRGTGWFLAYTMILCVVLIAICWLKGEPPAWRWGDE